MGTSSKTKDCRDCGAVGLRWRKTAPRTWRLFNQDKTPHRCRVAAIIQDNADHAEEIAAYLRRVPAAGNRFTTSAARAAGNGSGRNAPAGRQAENPQAEPNRGA